MSSACLTRCVAFFKKKKYIYVYIYIYILKKKAAGVIRLFDAVRGNDKSLPCV